MVGSRSNSLRHEFKAQQSSNLEADDAEADDHDVVAAPPQGTADYAAAADMADWPRQLRYDVTRERVKVCAWHTGEEQPAVEEGFSSVLVMRNGRNGTFFPKDRKPIEVPVFCFCVCFISFIGASFCIEEFLGF